MWGVLTKARALQANISHPHPSQEEAVKILEWELNVALAKLRQTLGGSDQGQAVSPASADAVSNKLMLQLFVL